MLLVFPFQKIGKSRDGTQEFVETVEQIRGQLTAGTGPSALNKAGHDFILTCSYGQLFRGNLLASGELPSFVP
jgi:hypothetical protein